MAKPKIAEVPNDATAAEKVTPSRVPDHFGFTLAAFVESWCGHRDLEKIAADLGVPVTTENLDNLSGLASYIRRKGAYLPDLARRGGGVPLDVDVEALNEIVRENIGEDAFEAIANRIARRRHKAAEAVDESQPEAE